MVRRCGDRSSCKCDRSTYDFGLECDRPRATKGTITTRLLKRKRGISNFGDKRRQELDKIGKGGIRRYAMNNAIALLWTLLEAKILLTTEGIAAVRRN